MSVNRIIAPGFQQIENLPEIEYCSKTLTNGIPLYLLKEVEGEMIRVDFVTDGGTALTDDPLIALAANNLLTEGTTSKSAIKIAGQFDLFGAYVNKFVGSDHAGLSLYSLKRYLPEVLPLVKDILTAAVFPQSEIDIYLKNKKSKFLVNSEKPAVLTRRKMLNLLFGVNHPYGRTTSIDDFNNLNKHDIDEFFEKKYLHGNLNIFISGAYNEVDIQLIDGLFNKTEIKRERNSSGYLDIKNTGKPGRYFIKKKGAVQSSIRMGRLLFNIAHPDYPSFYFLNMLLGGYFGSRLMKNLREEKGYTYGIASGIVTNLHTGYLSIATEVKREVTDKAVDEIFIELKKLQTEPVPEEEMTTVRNYLMGRLLRDFDGPFAKTDRLRSVLPFGFDNDFFKSIATEARNITKERVMEMACRYFDADEMIVVISGEKKE